MRRALAVVVVVAYGIFAAAALPDVSRAAGSVARASAASQTSRCSVSQRLVAVLQRESHIDSKTFDSAARHRARVAEVRMARIRAHAPDPATARRAARVLSTFRAVLRAARGHRPRDKNVKRVIQRYNTASSNLLSRLSKTCGEGARAVAASATYAEQQGHHGVNTFSNYHNASGMGPAIAPGAWVQVSCKVYDPYIQSVNPDGYWYRIASAPWNDAYFSPANTFMNGDPWNGPYTHNTDYNVPDCGAAPPPAPSPSVGLTQGPTAPTGYRYAVTVDNFAANSSVSVNCRDSANPSGFYTFSLPTDANGHGFTQDYCYSGDGPDHWVVVNGGVESNHVTWAAGSGGGTTGGGTTGGAPGSDSEAGGGSTGSSVPGIDGKDTCQSYSGKRILDPIVEMAGTNPRSVSAALFQHYLGGSGQPAVIDWSFFSKNGDFVQEATSLDIGQFVSGWAPSDPTSDMYTALAHFTIERDTFDCYLVYDKYDFNGLYLPVSLAERFGAKTFDVHASGKLPAGGGGW